MEDDSEQTGGVSEQKEEISQSKKEEKVIVFLGDSILDNGSYVRGKKGGSVTQQLSKKVKDLGYRVQNCAIDGDVMAGIESQIENIPKDINISLIVLSIGGNDCLRVNTKIFSFFLDFKNFKTLETFKI